MIDDQDDTARNWSAVRNAVIAQAAGQKFVRSCRSVREWIDLPKNGWSVALAQLLTHASTARTVLNASARVASRLWRESHGVDVLPMVDAASALDARLREGTATPAAAAPHRLCVVARHGALDARTRVVPTRKPTGSARAEQPPGGAAVNDPFDCGIELSDSTLLGWQIRGLDMTAEVVMIAACYSR